MTTSVLNHKIKDSHLNRKAVVYLRQSSEGQVLRNQESKRLQYALADRARAMGWKEVETIDTDLGSSASVGAAVRNGFEKLLASVVLGDVGIIFSREASRLSRTDKDWCHLLEVCSIFGTLLADEDQIYDINLLDDQLVLGIKGTLSVVELKIMKARLLAGQEEKARRGELVRLVAPGYVRDPLGKIVKDPNHRVQEAIALIFEKFRSAWSIRQTLKWFLDHEITLPVNKAAAGKRTVVFQLPTSSFVRYVLHNPIYAGAYVYGQAPRELRIVNGRPTRRQGAKRQPEECRVFIRDHHEGYISWEVFEEHQRMIRNNRTHDDNDESISAVRSGHGLLAGLLRCGRCGRKFHVRYWGKSGTAARYLCAGDFMAGGQYCLAFGGATVDRRFSEEIVRVISPLGVQASLDAMEKHSAADNQKQQLLLRELQQLEYETQRAFEQYNEVDSRNRLVASELERRWNAKIEERNRAKTSLTNLQEAQRPIGDFEKRNILALGKRFAETWNSPIFPIETKKKIMRTAVKAIIVGLDETTKMLSFVIHWNGGSHTPFTMPKPASPVGRKTEIEDIELVRKMAVRYGDDEIARVLNKLGRRTGKDKRWNEFRVATVRKSYSIDGQKRAVKNPEILSLGQAVAYCRVSDTTLRRLMAEGVLKIEQIAPWAPWEIRRADLDSEPIHGILENLRTTGKLHIRGNKPENQIPLF